MQITTNNKIYIFLLDLETLIPTLENVINNYLNCSQMMFGSKVKYGITFKTGEKSFSIHRRKYEHDYLVNVVEDDLDGCKGLPVVTINAFLVSKVNVIEFYDIDTFKEIESSKITIPLLECSTREPNEIISMQISKCENILAVISGKNLIMNEQYPN